MRNLIVITVLLLTGCAYSIKDIDVSKAQQKCVRECSSNYSSCVSNGNQVGFKTETLRACKESFEICVNTCPAK